MKGGTARAWIVAIGLWAGHAQAQVGIGHWRDHFPYRHTIAVVEGADKVYCATTNAVFSYAPADNSIERLTKVNALSDVNILSLGWNSTLGALLVGYSNGNLDMVRGGSTTNLGDIKRSSLLGDKGIYSIVCEGTMAYLCCGFGIVQMDLDRKEVRDTWLIGPNASQVQVNALAFYNDSIYAATPSGLFAAWRQEPNLAAFTNWHKRTDVPQANGPFTAVASFAGRLFVNYRLSDTQEKDTLYYWDGAWQRMAVEYSNRNQAVRVSADGQHMVVTHLYNLREFDTGLTETLFKQNVGADPLFPRVTVSGSTGGVWVASDSWGLVRYADGGDGGQRYYPNGPANASAYKIVCEQGDVYVATGSVEGNWGNSYRKDGVHHLIDGQWGTTDMTNDPLFQTGANTYGGTVNDMMCVAVDPADPKHAYAGSWDDGLLDLSNGHVSTILNASNSSLQNNTAFGTGNVVQVGGAIYDVDGNLWVTNSNCTSPISVHTASGSWRAFTPTVLNNNTLLSDIIVGQNGYKWCIRPRTNGLLVFNDNGTISDLSDDSYKVLTSFDGQGKLPSMDVFSIAEDLDGQVWVGTGKGVAVFYSPDLIFTSENFDCQQILIEQDGNVQILLETESVSAIAVDGANRKWLGTQSSGVYLVSADGTEQIQHFTKANSPLPSDNITCVAVDQSTGEVFIGTDQGIMSYRSDATGGGETADCAMVFPNPVRETYSGPVAITGLVRDSDVRITDMAGNLVYRTISLGGQAVWPATDMDGKRVATGVYLVMASDPTGQYNCNTKVLVVR